MNLRNNALCLVLLTSSMQYLCSTGLDLSAVMARVSRSGRDVLLRERLTLALDPSRQPLVRVLLVGRHHIHQLQPCALVVRP